jgi:hypothetical protein
MKRRRIEAVTRRMVVVRRRARRTFIVGRTRGKIEEGGGLNGKLRFEESAENRGERLNPLRAGFTHALK